MRCVMARRYWLEDAHLTYAVETQMRRGELRREEET